MSTAIVIGATGLVGKNLVQQLLADPAWTRVVALVRRPTALRHGMYEEHVVDFDQPTSFADRVKGDVLFSAMGTTRSAAGSIEAQRKVDYTYQLEVAKLAAKNGVKTYVLISSVSANAGSSNAYLKMKGELDREVKTLGFSSVQILQPGLLVGERETPRLGEGLARTVLGAVNKLGLFREVGPIGGDQVARAMRKAATLTGTEVHTGAALFKMNP